MTLRATNLERIKDLHNVANHTLSTDSTSHEPRAMPHDLLQDSLNRKQSVCMTSTSIKPKSHSHQPIPSPFVLWDESVDGHYLSSNANWNVASSNWLCFFVSYAGSPSHDRAMLALWAGTTRLEPLHELLQWRPPMGPLRCLLPLWLHLSKLELPSNAHDKCLNKRSYSWWHDTCDSPNWD